MPFLTVASPLESVGALLMMSGESSNALGLGVSGSEEGLAAMSGATEVVGFGLYPGWISALL